MDIKLTVGSFLMVPDNDRLWRVTKRGSKGVSVVDALNSKRKLFINFGDPIYCPVEWRKKIVRKKSK